MKKLIRFLVFVAVGSLMVVSCVTPSTPSTSSSTPSTTQTTEPTSTSSQEAAAPIITVDNAKLVINAGQTYDLLEGVIALDIIDGSLTSSIQVNNGGYDNNIPGIYTITFTVTNSKGKTATATKEVEVKAMITAVEISGHQYPALINPRLDAQYTSQVFGYTLDKVTVFEKDYFNWMKTNMPERLGTYYGIIAVTNGDGTVRELRTPLGGHVKDYGLENGGVTMKNATTWCPSPSAPTNDAAPYCGLYEGAQLANIEPLADGAYVVVFPNGGLGTDGNPNTDGSPRFFGDTYLIKNSSEVINNTKIKIVNIPEKDKFNANNTRPIIKLPRNSEKVEIYIGSPLPNILDGVTVIDNKDTNLVPTYEVYFYAGQGKLGAKVDAISTASATIYTVVYTVTDSDGNIDHMYRQYTVKTEPDSLKIDGHKYDAVFDVTDFFKQCKEGSSSSGDSCYNTKYATKAQIYVLDRDFVVNEKAITGQYLSKITSTFVAVVDKDGHVKTARNILGDYWLPIPETGKLEGQNDAGWFKLNTLIFDRNSDMLKKIEDYSTSGDYIIIAPAGGLANTQGIKPRDYLAYHLYNPWNDYPTSPAAAPNGWRGDGTINLSAKVITVIKSSPDVEPVKLDAPTELTITNGVLTWNKVTNAAKYEVTFKNTSLTPILVTTNQYVLDTAGANVGEYQIVVKAIGDGKYYINSDASAEVSYTQPVRTLPSVTNVKVSEEKVITWNAVTHSIEYKIIIQKFVEGAKVDEQVINQTATSYDASTLADGNYKVSVTAVGDGVEYNNGVTSSEVDFAIGLPQLAMPNSLAITNDVATWNEVTNATGYVVKAVNKVTNTEYTYNVTSNTATLTGFINTVGEFDITVHATADGYKASDDSSKGFYRSLVGKNKLMINGDVTGFDIKYIDITTLKAGWATAPTSYAAAKTIYVIEDISTTENIAVLDSWTSNGAKNNMTMVVSADGHIKLVRTVLGNFQWTPSTGWVVSTEYGSGTNHFINLSKYISEGDILVVSTNVASTVGQAASPRDFLANFTMGTWANYDTNSMKAISGESWRATSTATLIDNTNTIVYFGKAN